MNPAALEPVRWPRRRWVYAIGGVLAFQAVLVFALGKRASPSLERPIFRTSVSLLTDDLESRRWLAKLEDPALLALPTIGGFSGSAWMKFAPMDYQPAEWSEPPQWLTLNSSLLGGTFSQFVSSNVARPALLVDKPLPAPVNFEPNYPNEPVAQESRLRFEGELAGRRLLQPVILKSWPHPDILSNSVVEAVVDADGFVFSSVLLHSSGSRNADDYAMKVAASARFEPAPRRGSRTTGMGGTVTVGKLTFEWHTLPASTGETLPPQP
jgi:TonB family protein